MAADVDDPKLGDVLFRVIVRVRILFLATLSPGIAAADDVVRQVSEIDAAAPEPDGAAAPEPDRPAQRRPSADTARRAAVATTGVLHEQTGRFGRARIAVRGIDRDPALARRVVASLERRPEVRRAVASATTGRVLVEFSERVTSIQDLVAEISKVELPDAPDEDRPAHPLDPAPIVQSGARVFTEVRLRREAWKEYERRLQHVTEAQAGAVVRIESGARVPLRARLIEGQGTVIAADGLPDPVCPGDQIDAGARVTSGALVLELIAGDAWQPSPRPAPPRPDNFTRYLALLGPASLAYAVVHALRRRSPAAAFTGLLLVNPRAAVIGTDAADAGASARVLRAGVTVVGTRPDRQIRRPDVVVIDGPRVLTDGLRRTEQLEKPGAVATREHGRDQPHGLPVIQGWVLLVRLNLGHPVMADLVVFATEQRQDRQPTRGEQAGSPT